ncbi:MAG: L-seryl-tRNA(Sec) selenium transferase [Pyrinomonadaceae bacterium]
MPSARKPDPNSVLRSLPSVDELLRSTTGKDILASGGHRHAGDLARHVIRELRRIVVSGGNSFSSKSELLREAEAVLLDTWKQQQLMPLRRVINATGVIIHTNLGRAPLSDIARRSIADEASGYCTLEYDLITGTRGKRGRLAEDLVTELTGAEAVLIVNNCAAAAFFVLSVFAAGGEVIVSRGELVEIGGDFRIPDVLAESFAVLKEVGTTNRTKLSDYENALGENTRMIMRVHPSNYRILGFTETPALSDLAALASRKGLVFYEDLGSGALTDLTAFGLADEPVVGSSLAAGAHIVTFSADKLLGGPQAGIIAGKATYVDQLRKHPLYRALRVDKFTLAGLEATLAAYRRDAALDEIPVLRMLSQDARKIGERVAPFVAALEAKREGREGLSLEVIDGRSAIGGGAAPDVELKTKLIALDHNGMSSSQTEQMLRQADPPVITRITEDRVVLDLRTVAETEEHLLLEILSAL